MQTAWRIVASKRACNVCNVSAATGRFPLRNPYGWCSACTAKIRELPAHVNLAVPMLDDGFSGRRGAFNPPHTGFMFPPFSHDDRNQLTSLASNTTTAPNAEHFSAFLHTIYECPMSFPILAIHQRTQHRFEAWLSLMCVRYCRSVIRQQALPPEWSEHDPLWWAPFLGHGPMHINRLVLCPHCDPTWLLRGWTCHHCLGEVATLSSHFMAGHRCFMS